MAKITIDGREIEAEAGATLLEVCKAAGVYISSLCYIDGLPPYAGCRMCLVEIEGMRGLQLSCTTKVTDEMIVRTTIPDVADARKQVLSIILANHSDRCLTCHRREHCHPGDICLRDGVITHRCVTCPKNYRCELQTTCEVVGMSLYEPWENEARSFYAVEEHPPADQGNPFLEFDPKMCIICTRCVRACDEIRHTGAITLAGRGFGTRIAFGAGGPIDESNCDFCGACIDVCPTATLLEHPHKWIAKPQRWVPTVCSYCSVGCTISLGVKDGRGVMVRPNDANPVSGTQICVRGRFHYDALRKRDYLSRPLIRRGDLMAPVGWDEVMGTVADRLLGVKQRHGAGAIGFLGSPLNTNEELYLLQRVARGTIGCNNIDFSGGAVAARVGDALRGAFGSEVLPADLTALAKATHILVVGDDLEASHPVASLRLKDAVVSNQAQLIYVSPRWGELVDFADAWLRPRAGASAATLAELSHELLADASLRSSLTEAGVGGVESLAAQPTGADAERLQYFDEALKILREAIMRGPEARVAVVFAPAAVGAWSGAATAQAAANLTILVAGPERAPDSFFYLPTDVNVIGLRDMGVTSTMLPGYHRLNDAAFREQLMTVWNTPVPTDPGLDFRAMLQAAREGSLKALVILGDNPLMNGTNSTEIREALARLDVLVVIDAIMTDTAALAEIVLPDTDVYGKEGTYTPADRRVLKRLPATDPIGEARPAWATLLDLGDRLARKQGLGISFAFAGPAAVMNEIASLLPLYAHARYPELVLGERSQILNGAVPTRPMLHRMEAAAPATSGNGDFALLTGRTLYTSVEAAALHKPDADKLRREDKLEMSPDDAARLGVTEGDSLRVATDLGAIEIAAHLSEGVQAGSVFVPLLYDGGAINALLGLDEGGAAPRVSVAAKRAGGG